jgi:hypothetical protein
MKSPVFSKVKGRNNTKNPLQDSQRDIEHTFQTFRVPKDFGMVNVAICVMESDDESEKKRVELKEKFAEQWVDVKAQEPGFLETWGKAIAEDWQVGHVEVTAWTRNGRIKVGTVHSGPVNQWVKGGKSIPIVFNNPSGLIDTGVTTDELMPHVLGMEQLSPIQQGHLTRQLRPIRVLQQTRQPPSGPDPANLALLDKFVGKWAYNWGTLTLTRVGNELRGTTRRYDSMQRTEINAETMVLNLSADGTRIEGP